MEMEYDNRPGTDGIDEPLLGATHQQRQCSDLKIVRRLATALLVLAYSWWAVSAPPFSASATVAVLVPGGAAMVLGRFWRRPERERHRTRGIGLWVAVAAALVCWQLIAYLEHPRVDHPTLSSLTNALLDSHLSRAAAFAVWLLGAVGLARR